MTPLALYVLTAMVSWIDPSTHASFEPRDVTIARYESIATDISLAADEFPTVDGDVAHTAILLASIASYESAYSAKVDDCSKPGGKPGERAWSIFQIQGRRADLCGSRLNAARVALRMIGESLTACRSRAVDALSLYSVGHCTKDEKARWRLSRAKRWWIANVFQLEDGA